MLIVVAIIAILIAISIPLIQNALERAKHATDAANERAVKAVVLLAQLDGTLGDSAGTAFALDTAYAYDAKTGKLVNDATDMTMYGQHKEHNQGCIVVTMISTESGAGDPAGTIFMEWQSTVDLNSPLAADGDLCINAKDVAHTAP